MIGAERLQLRGVALVLLSALCFGAISILVLLALGLGISLIELMQWRFVVATMILALVLRGRLRAPPRLSLPLFAVGAVGQAAVTFVSLSALQFIRPAAMSFLFFTYPAWLAAGAAVTGYVPFTRSRVLALALALAGVTIMLRPGSAELLDLRGVALGLLAAMLYAAYLPALSRFQSGLPAPTSAFYVILGAAISFTVAAMLATPQTLPRSATLWVLIGLLAVVCTVLSFAFLVAGVAILGAVKTSVIGTSEPFLTAILAAIILGDPIRLTTIAGGSLIAAAVLVTARAGLTELRTTKLRAAS